MRIAFIVGRFPVLSETFILNQITGLIDRGHEVDIYANHWGDRENVHPDVLKYNLLEKTYLLEPIPQGLFPRLFGGSILFAKYLFYLANAIVTLLDWKWNGDVVQTSKM